MTTENGDKFAAIVGNAICVALVATIWICQGCTVHVEYDKKAESEKPKAQVNDISKKCKYGTFDGHEYVIYNSESGAWAVGGITHSPNCPCAETEGKDKK